MRALLRDVRRFPARLLRWLGEARQIPSLRHAALFPVGIIVAGGLGLLVADNRVEMIQTAGVALEVLGLFTVAWGLRHMRGLFPSRPAPQTLREWWSRRPRLRPRPRTILGAGTARFGISGKAAATVHRAPNRTLPERVDALERDVDRLQERTRDLDQSIQAEQEARREADEEEATERKKADERLEQLVEEVAVGGISLEAVGLAWVLFGVVLAGVPEQVEAVLRIVLGS